jgi:beta-lactam-binding protein with PASTA domain
MPPLIGSLTYSPLRLQRTFSTSNETTMGIQMKRTISSMLALAMVAALMAIFAGAANAQTESGKVQLTAVNGMLGTTVTVTATDADGTPYDLGQDLAEGAVGTPVVIDPGTYTVAFNDGAADVASVEVEVEAVQAWTVVSGYGDPDGAMAYPVMFDATVPAVYFENSATVDVTVDGDVGTIPPGAQMGNYAPAVYTLTTGGGATATADLTGVPDASYTDVVAVGDDSNIVAAIVTIADLAALKVSLEPAAPPTGVVVPDVVGQTEADANTAITDLGLVAAKTEAADDTVPAGSVVSQDPAAGAEVADGSTVNIVISTGPDAPATVPVPDVTGTSAADAQAEIEAAGFTVTTEEQESDTVEAGLVIETNPSAGTEVAAGTEVKIIVSSGAGDVVVPDFTGMTVDNATAAAEAAGLTISFVEDADDPDPEGVVVSQDPSGGTTVEAGTEVVAQLSPAIDDPWVTLTLSPERVLSASGINFQPGSTVDLSVIDTDKSATATVQDDGSWAASFDLSDNQSEEELLLVTGTAADGSDYESTFKIPAAEESSGVSAWVWILLGLLVVAIVLLGIKMFGGGGDTTGRDDASGSDAPGTDAN